MSQTRKTKEYYKKSSESFVSIILICCQILSPWLGDIVASGIALLYWPASLCSLAGRYDNPMPESTIYSSKGLRIGYWLTQCVTPLMYEWCFVLLLNGKISSCYTGRLYLRTLAFLLQLNWLNLIPLPRKSSNIGYISVRPYQYKRGCSSVVERLIRNQKASGSIPDISKFFH